MLVLRLQDQQGAQRQAKSKSMRWHCIRYPIATLSPGVDRGMWLAIALTPIARLRRSVDVCLCPSICFVFFCRASNIPSTVATCRPSRRRSHYFLQAGASRGTRQASCLPACSGVMGPRAQVGPRRTSGVNAYIFCRKSGFAQWTVSGRTVDGTVDGEKLGIFNSGR